ncbi:sensor histidine kinase [Aridibaculum aurantiacum]|uniref:sensor histidine kinase n=1 Tax=Aridibaculum aurantiacum TaxID=2810307 RepID=UPI001A976A12|nr:HAMP domain-containing sensor histidine kinase [Aridibaculum aurantiacum]
MTAQQKIHIARAMMVATILLIVGFQVYWISRLYNDEKSALQREADVVFREAVYKVQVANFKMDTSFFEQAGENLFNVEAINVMKRKAVASGKKGDTLPNQVIIQLKDPQQNEVKKLGIDTVPAAAHFQITKRNVEPGNQMRVMYRRLEGDSSLVKNSDSLLQEVQKRILEMRANGDTITRFVMKHTQEVQPPEPIKTIEKAPAKATIRINNIALKESDDQAQDVLKKPAQPIRIFTTTAFADTLSMAKLDSAYQLELSKSGIKVPFNIIKYKDKKKNEIIIDSTVLATSPVPVGMVKPNFYQAQFNSFTPYLFGKIGPQMALSILLVAFTVASFIVMYRNVLAQQQLAEMKNEFISNITHELKTPIATVNVAIEAMKSFNALHHPERTKEYLDISSSELQRLSLLVDKVLKLSMFEKKDVELNIERVDLRQLVQEVLGSMRLQFEKCKGQVSFNTSGENFHLEGDRLHITSVIYNLLDNAIKYCKEDLQVEVAIEAKEEVVQLMVRDNGIGIQPEFKDKIFEKFFRVPMHNKHNIKGYGLGLSYVAHIVQQHRGSIKVESVPGVGSSFVVQFPKV